MNQNILLVEDDQNFGDVLRSYLEMHDYNVTLATDGVQGYEAFKKGKYDLSPIPHSTQVYKFHLGSFQLHTNVLLLCW